MPRVLETSASDAPWAVDGRRPRTGIKADVYVSPRAEGGWPAEGTAGSEGTVGVSAEAGVGVAAAPDEAVAAKTLKVGVPFDRAGFWWRERWRGKRSRNVHPEEVSKSPGKSTPA